MCSMKKVVRKNFANSQKNTFAASVQPSEKEERQDSVFTENFCETFQNSFFFGMPLGNYSRNVLLASFIQLG